MCPFPVSCGQWQIPFCWRSMQCCSSHTFFFMSVMVHVCLWDNLPWVSKWFGALNCICHGPDLFFLRRILAFLFLGFWSWVPLKFMVGFPFVRRDLARAFSNTSWSLTLALGGSGRCRWGYGDGVFVGRVLHHRILPVNMGLAETYLVLIWSLGLLPFGVAQRAHCGSMTLPTRGAS